MKPKQTRNVFLLPGNEDKWKILEEAFNLPPEEREAYLINKLKEKKVEYLGYTDKTAPELATDCIKKGIRAKSFVKGTKSNEST